MWYIIYVISEANVFSDPNYDRQNYVLYIIEINLKKTKARVVYIGV